MEKTKRNLLLKTLCCLLLLTMAGCDDEGSCCTIIDVDVYVHYQNQEGENLINSSDEFDESKIKIYYKNGNEYDYVKNDNLTYPNHHFVSEDANQNLILTIFPSNYYEGNRSTTLIELNNNHVDTLICEFELDGNNEIYKRGWLNGIEIMDRFIEYKN